MTLSEFMDLPNTGGIDCALLGLCTVGQQLTAIGLMVCITAMLLALALDAIRGH